MFESAEIGHSIDRKTYKAREPGLRAALLDAKHRIRAQYKFYSQDLINNLFTHPYTKIEFIERDLSVSRLTATKYLDTLAEGGFVKKQKIGRNNYYINLALNAILRR